MKEYMGAKEYERMKGMLRPSKRDTILEQLHKAEKEMPELFAAFNLLSLALYGEIEELDRKRANDDSDSMVNVIEPVVIQAALRLPLWQQLGINERDLCEKLNRWAAAVHFRRLSRGILQETAHYCDDGG